MSMCDRCAVSGCALNYNGVACRNARKKLCPDVVFTNEDLILDMDTSQLAALLFKFRLDACCSEHRLPDSLDAITEWLESPFEEA